MTLFVKKSTSAMFVVLLCFGVLTWSLDGHAKVQVVLEKTTMQVGEQVQMVIHSDQSGELDESSLRILQPFFQIGGTSRQQQIQIINGQQSVTNSWQVLLLAVKEGKHQIGSFKVGTQMTRPFEVTITSIQAKANPTAQADDFLLLGEVDTLDPYVKSEVIYSLKLMVVKHRRNHLLGGQLSRLVVGNLPIKTITKEKRYDTTYQGQQYSVIEWRFAFISHVSGEILIPPIVFAGSVQRPTGRKNIRLATQSVTLKVKPQAPGWSQVKADWLPAKSLNIWEKWQPSVSQWVAGQRYRREIKLEAKGIEAKQLADLSVDANAPHYSSYPQNPAREEGLNEHGHYAKYSHQIDYVPKQAGILTLPEIKIPWWDGKNDQLRYAILPARQIKVLANAHAENQPDHSLLSTPVNHLIGGVSESTNSLVVNLEDLQPEQIEALKLKLNNHSEQLSLFDMTSTTVKMGLSVMVLLYSCLLLMVGHWIGRKRRKDDIDGAPSMQIPVSFSEAIEDMQRMLKMRKKRRIHLIYQVMLRCYNKHHSKLSLTLMRQWLKYIEQLRIAVYSDSKSVSFDFSSLADLLQQTLKQQNKGKPSDLPSLYPR